MLNMLLSESQFLMLLTAAMAIAIGYLARALLLPWIVRMRQRQLRYFQPHAYQPEAGQASPRKPAERA
ncbi:hypothetical protein [Chromobacterium alticapitis]|uniref:Uncharacterized protein n=1 Tax=Chromobacterium alticapitis TaxID=2073169 RepID=A0A2S5DC51_9NEIS|nr:hypothetical protein [Chromobacterium alticapitis]POZ60537.1 hypothetical protein C2I19_18390 [Chromobacterium alticapitis]